MNVWIARLNMEAAYGTPATLRTVFAEAVAAYVLVASCCPPVHSCVSARISGIDVHICSNLQQ